MINAFVCITDDAMERIVVFIYDLAMFNVLQT